MAETSVTVTAINHNVFDPYIKILQTRPNDIDISFSSYLKPGNNNNEQQQKNQEEDPELSIFEAKRYFSEIGNNDRSQTKNLTDSRFSSVSSSKDSSLTLGHKASSEASWNSQTGLLDNRKGLDRDHGRGSSKKGWFFRRRTCPCSSSKSVQVQETKSRTGSDRVVSNRIVQTISSSDPIRLTIPSNTMTRSRNLVSNFTFPALNETSQSQTSENPRKPVLNPTKPVLNSIKPVLNPVKPVLNSTKPILNPTNLKNMTTDEESTSDASSDLFEIESFSTQPAPRPWAPPVVRDLIDETATEYGYEPSEASVTWSVTTAEPASAIATNFSRISLSSSLASSGCDRRTGLLSCRGEQAVMVNSVQRLVQPFKSVSVQDDAIEKVLCNNGSSKLSVTSRTMLI